MECQVGDCCKDAYRGLVKRLADPGRKLRENQQRVDELSLDLLRRFQERCANARTNWRKSAGRLGALSPLAVLERGYSITHKLPEETDRQKCRIVGNRRSSCALPLRGESRFAASKTRSEMKALAVCNFSDPVAGARCRPWGRHNKDQLATKVEVLQGEVVEVKVSGDGSRCRRRSHGLTRESIFTPTGRRFQRDRRRRRRSEAGAGEASSSKLTSRDGVHSQRETPVQDKSQSVPQESFNVPPGFDQMSSGNPRGNSPRADGVRACLCGLGTGASLGSAFRSSRAA